MSTMDPIAFTTARYTDRKISDAKSVKVTIPTSKVLLAGEAFYVSPFLGLLTENVTTVSPATAEAILEVGPLVCTTTKLTAEQNFTLGTIVYWSTATDKFTETPTDILAGVVYKAKGREATPVAHIFILGPSIAALDPTDMAAIKAAFANIVLTDFDDAVFADINTVAAALKDADLTDIAGISKQAHLADVAAVTATTVENVAGADAAALVTDINKAGGIVASLNTLRTEINATGGIKDVINKILKSLEDAGIHATS